jgi:hypothetical protein
LLAGAIYVFVYDSTDDKWIVQGNPNVGFEAGTKVLFQQTTAPIGWTKDTTHNNKALRVVSGTASSGGTTAFTSVFTSRTIAEANLPSHTHSFSATTSSNGSHDHFAFNNDVVSSTLSASNYPGRSVNLGSDQDYTIGASAVSPSVGLTSSNGAHTHTVSGTSGATGSGTAMDFAVQYVDVTICTRD